MEVASSACTVRQNSWLWSVHLVKGVASRLGEAERALQGGSCTSRVLYFHLGDLVMSLMVATFRGAAQLLQPW